MTDYPRMKYASEQRDWVRVADEKLPTLIQEATNMQLHAAHMYADYQLMTLEQKLKWPWAQQMVSETYKDAHMRLLRVLYYQGMRNANLPRE